jgi:hypothetical protein
VAEHELKTLPPYFEDVLTGRKTFEVRKADRNFAVGDVLRLREWAPDDWCDESVGVFPDYTGREMRVKVTYILRGYGLQDGYVVLGIEPADADERLKVLLQVDEVRGILEALGSFFGEIERRTEAPLMAIAGDVTPLGIRLGDLRAALGPWLEAIRS